MSNYFTKIQKQHLVTKIRPIILKTVITTNSTYTEDDFSYCEQLQAAHACITVI
jgi:hypothetical protein